MARVSEWLSEAPAVPPEPQLTHHRSWAQRLFLPWAAHAERARSGSLDSEAAYRRTSSHCEAVELFVKYPPDDDQRGSLESYVVARTAPRSPPPTEERLSGSSSTKARSAEYASEMLSRAEDVDDAVDGAVCDQQHTTNASRKTDRLAATAPMKLRRLAEKAAAVSRQDPGALVNLLRLDPKETALQDAYDALLATADAARQWLSYPPWKRGYAVSFKSAVYGQQQQQQQGHHHQSWHHHQSHEHQQQQQQQQARVVVGDDFEERGSVADGLFLQQHNSTSTTASLSSSTTPSQPHRRLPVVLTKTLAPNSLAHKYATKLEDAFQRVSTCLARLDNLRARLPTTARLVRFSQQPSIVDGDDPTDFSDDDEEHEKDDAKYDARDVDDFLTDAAPLGIGIFSSEVFACRGEDGDLFLTSNWRTADALQTLNHCCQKEEEADDEHALSSSANLAEQKHADDDDHGASDDDDAPSDDDRGASSSSVAAAPRPRRRRERPGVLATTTIYKVIDDPRKMALDDGDEIWAVTIDAKDYFFCVTADLADRGLRHALEIAGVDLATLGALGITFRHVE